MCATIDTLYFLWIIPQNTHERKMKMSIEATRKGFEASFAEAAFYNKQTQDNEHLTNIY